MNGLLMFIGALAVFVVLASGLYYVLTNVRIGKDTSDNSVENETDKE